MLREQIRAYFADHRQELIDDIMALIRIESVCGKPVCGRPFGEQNARALQTAADIAARMGLRAANWENYVAVVDLGEKPSRLDILAHLDVVPGGGNWTVTKPFEPLLKDGRLYGRGAIDDKGPAMAALHALNAARRLGVQLSGNARLILGTDEETACRDIEYYYSQNTEAPHTFSPDAGFPVINIEKGGLYCGYSASWPVAGDLPRVHLLESGTAGNVVPGKARCVIEGLAADIIREACAVAGASGIRYDVEALEEPGFVAVEATGRGAHASTPWEGNSALTGLLAVLLTLPLASGSGLSALRGLGALFPHGDYYGEAAGIAMEDGESGRLTLTTNVIHFGLAGVTGKVDSRVPLCATEETVIDVLAAAMKGYGLYLEPDAALVPPHHVPEDSGFVQTLLRCYEEHMGEKGYCIALGGGTYVHRLKSGVAFGCMMPGRDYNLHGADEYLVVDEIVRCAELFTRVIVELCT